MSSQPRRSASYRDGLRGRHKRVTSPETRRGNAEHLIPKRPPWMDVETYLKLARLRNELDEARYVTREGQS